MRAALAHEHVPRNALHWDGDHVATNKIKPKHRLAFNFTHSHRAGDYTSVAEARAYGITGYIKKPFSSDQLRKKLNVASRVISHRKLENTG